MKGPLLQVGGNADAGTVSAVAEAVGAILLIGADTRTSEGVMHAALGVLLKACSTEGVTVQNCTFDSGDRSTVTQ